MKHSCTVSGVDSVHGFSCVGFLPCTLSRGVLPSRPYLTRRSYATCVFHQPGWDLRVFSEFFLRAAVNVASGCADDSAQQHHCVLDEPVRWLVSFHCILCSDFCFAHCCHTASERNDCWLRVFSATPLMMFRCLSAFAAMHVTHSFGIVSVFTAEFMSMKYRSIGTVGLLD